MSNNYNRSKYDRDNYGRNEYDRNNYGRNNLYDDDRISKFYFPSVTKYLALCILFCAIIYGVNSVVMGAIKASPTASVGNGILSLYEVHNLGAAFNLFQGQSEMLIMGAFIAVAVMAFVVLIRSAYLSHNAISSMALLSSGILMNMFERITRGYVIDYIHCDFMPNFPMFNTSDILIVCGALGIILAVLSYRKNND